LIKKKQRFRVFHIDDLVSGVESTDTNILELNRREITDNPITSIAISDSILLISRQSGVLLQFGMPSLTFETSYSTNFQWAKIDINSDSTRCSLLDKSGIMRLLDIKKLNVDPCQFAEGFERKDVWDVKWANDDPKSFAIMEKTRLFVINGIEAEDPLTWAGCILKLIRYL
jgi:WD repeat-containing protein 35